jgi:rSAM/selenodomain-associated transferase 2
MITISIIIPTLNEVERIGPLLEYVRTAAGDVEVIVVDGGSRDGTLDRVGTAARVVASPRGRAVQMNAGARVASGDVLWFVHADCRPHPGSIAAMRQALLDPDVVGGAFEYSLDVSRRFFRLVEAASNLKNRLAGLAYGDMGVFVRADAFRDLGGFREWPIMEDLDLCRRMKRVGKVAILPQRISTSTKRWTEEGILYNIVRNWCLQVAWLLGASPTALARFYAFPPRRKTKCT